jgi:hypothetical protein
MHASRGTGPNFIKSGRVFYFRADLDDWLQRAPDSRPSRRGVSFGPQRAKILPKPSSSARTFVIGDFEK